MYRLLVKQRAKRDVSRLPPSVRERVFSVVRALTDEPRPPGCQKLTEREEWRLRVGDYRVLYEVDDAAQTVTVVRIKHRREMYR